MRTLLRTASLSLAFLLSNGIAHADVLRDHPGYWLGEVKLPGGEVRKLGAELFTRADGSAWASVAWPEQGVIDIPVKAVREVSKDAVLLDLGQASLGMSWAGDHFESEWKQGGGTLHASLAPAGGYPVRARPQTPHPPFPYREETLAIPSKPGVTLGATLTLPQGVAHPNVVVLVHGSGPASRHAELFGHRWFDVLADHLTRQGVAVLRYDKRGIARSTGDFHGHTNADLADDVEAVVRALATRKEFGRIGLAGHSEGSEVAAAVAARDPQQVGFIVSLAGLGMSGFDLMLQQDRLEAADHGANPQELERIMPYVRKYYETVLATPDGEPRVQALKAVYAALSPEDQALIVKYRMNQVTLSPAFAAGPSLPATLSTDARRDWRRVRCPALILNGTLDHQVPGEENVAGIKAALKEGGNTQVEAALLPSLNHLFQTASTGDFAEYAQIDETIAPQVLSRVAAFARRQ